MEALGGYPTRSSNPKAKKLTVLLSMTVGVGCLFLLQTQLLKPRRPSDFYSFEVKDAKGRTVSLEKYRGKASLVVNVASYSEQTEGNYRYLQELHRELGTSHFNVLAFPCGQFGDTEPGTSRDSEAFAKATYGVTFPFFNRIKIMGSEADGFLSSPFLSFPLLIKQTSYADSCVVFLLPPPYLFTGIAAFGAA
uniref:Glutathione peroxidase n=2 Tax=Takifugu rubripes TaxID=31033 RepID=A0A674NAX9_TAKRU